MNYKAIQGALLQSLAASNRCLKISLYVTHLSKSLAFVVEHFSTCVFERDSILYLSTTEAFRCGETESTICIPLSLNQSN